MLKNIFILIGGVLALFIVYAFIIPHLNNPVTGTPLTETQENVMCAADVRECPDGSFMSRVSPSCAFAECPVLESPQAPAPTPIKGHPVFCTMDAKICPDGTAVGRVGPNCEFAPCPDLP